MCALAGELEGSHLTGEKPRLGGSREDPAWMMVAPFLGSPSSIHWYARNPTPLDEAPLITRFNHHHRIGSYGDSFKLVFMIFLTVRNSSSSPGVHESFDAPAVAFRS